MRLKLLIGAYLVGLGLGVHTALAQQLFTNLNFESAAFPSMLPAGTTVPASQALPGWTASPDSIWRNTVLARGPYINVSDIVLNPTAGSWPGAQGRYHVSLKAGWYPWPAAVSIAQTGYLSPDIRSLRFRLAGKPEDFTVSFAGQPLSCIIVSSNPYTVCAADVSRFAGTTGELKFLVSKASISDNPLVTLDDIFFSAEPAVPQQPQNTTLAVTRVGSDKLRLMFPIKTGANYSVQASTNLSAWTTVYAFEATATMLLYSDQGIATNNPTRVFYRVIGPAP